MKSGSASLTSRTVVGGQVLLLDVWRGRDSGPYMHALHFMFGMGAFLAPVLGRYTMHLLQSLSASVVDKSVGYNFLLTPL